MALMESPFKIILGSSSMPRQHILAEMGYDFTVMTADIDEKAIRKEKPEELVTALAEAKEEMLAWVKEKKDIEFSLNYPHTLYMDELLPFYRYFRRLSTTALEDSGSLLNAVHADAILSSLQNVDSFVEDVHTTLLITADTVVVHEGRIREKPYSKDEARNFIEGYSGGRAEVVGSVLVTNLKTGRREAGWERAEVGCHAGILYDIPAEVVQGLIDEGITLNVAGGLMLEHPLTSPIIKEIGTADTIMGLPKSLTERLIQEALTRPSSEACRNPA